MADLFVSDARDKMYRRSSSSTGTVAVTVLFVGNHLIDFDGVDEAHGLVYCRAHIRPDDAPDGRFVEQAVLYRDHYQREDGEWRFVRRAPELWHDVASTEPPVQTPRADGSRRNYGVAPVPCDEATWPACSSVPKP